MKKKFNNKKYIKEIKKNGYCIIPNFFSNKSIKKMRNSLLDGLHYIKPDNEKDLQKKYLQIKKYNKILSGHWYDITKQDINLSQEIHKTEIIQLVKDFFKTDVVFSGRLSLHIIEDTNARLLQPHQEDKQLARDFFLLWTPLFDTNRQNGGISIFEGTHKHEYFHHTDKLYKVPHKCPQCHVTSPKLFAKNFSYKMNKNNEYLSIVDPPIGKKFKKRDLEIKAGSLALFHSRLMHSGYPTRKKNSVRIVVSDRLCPLKKVPFLEDENALIKIPGADTVKYD